ncbi:hypothetical protein CKA38_06465 [Ereboglobus luteus]|uniref:Uncharacterized protein n=1 Tax=Ereboglobus luteus TaxID=1796921 RepID=A0A2U8E235_9BACT|nr:hypothetical protein CKA38_06465 [Ereboglobus luteus]
MMSVVYEFASGLTCGMNRGIESLRVWMVKIQEKSRLFFGATQAGFQTLLNAGALDAHSA